MNNYKPNIEYLLGYASFLRIKDVVMQGDGYASTSFVNRIIDLHSEYVKSQIENYLGLSLPSVSNSLPVAPVMNLISIRVIVDLISSHFQNTDRMKEWKQKLADTEKDFTSNCLFYLAQSVKGKSINQGFVQIDNVNIIP